MILLEEYIMSIFDRALWIRPVDGEGADSFADFIADFYSEKEGKDIVCIAADSDYTLYVNGTLASFGQYSDYPHHKFGDQVDVSHLTVKGINHIAVIAWYYGVPTQITHIGKAGTIFEVFSNGVSVYASSSQTLSRMSRTYRSGGCVTLTDQLGFTYHACQGDGFPTKVDLSTFDPSVEVEGISREVSPRPVERMELRSRLPVSYLQQGIFSYNARTGHLGRDMHKANLSMRERGEISNQELRQPKGDVILQAPEGDGIYFILDLEQECVGFLDFDIEVDEACLIEVGYGEHLIDGRCRTGMGGRNFTVSYDACAGRNIFMDTFRRLGGRYLQFFLHTHKATIHYAGLREVSYPLTYKKFESGNLLRDTIYEACQRTLDLCMHQHYEDCPWREQALYTMDSRNQMLCGYYAFGETRFPRASLSLIADSVRDDGLLAICAPSDDRMCIPSFCLAYFIQMAEYIEYSKDTTLAEEKYGMLCDLLATFRKQKRENGLLINFHDDVRCWNFYEWQPTVNGRFAYSPVRRSIAPPRFEAPLNAFYVLALQSMEKICRAIGKAEDADALSAEAKEICNAIQKHFYRPDVRLFATEADEVEYSVLTQSLCVLCGAADGVDQSRILAMLASNGKSEAELTVYPTTLSMCIYRYDALLSVDREQYRDIILQEIDQTYLSMLRAGATTFWETILGDSDFHDAGSLCHGWSAIPIYYYEVLK